MYNRVMENSTIDKKEFFRVMDEMQFDGEHDVTVDGQHALLIKSGDEWVLHLANDGIRKSAVVKCNDVERFEVNGWQMLMVMKNGDKRLIRIMETHWLDPASIFGKKQTKNA